MSDAPEKFNVLGTDGRTCPMCFRERGLIGARDGDAPKLTCRGCGNDFVLTWANGVQKDTLTRLSPRAAARSYPYKLTSPGAAK